MNRKIKTKIMAIIMVFAMLMPFAFPTAGSAAKLPDEEVATATDAIKEKDKSKESEARLYSNTIYVENRGSVSYGDTYNNQFYVPSVSKWAFCGDAGIECPGSGDYEYTLKQSAEWLDEVRGILLYADTIELSARNYLGIMRAINNARHSGNKTLGIEYQQAAAAFVRSNYPDGVMSISEAGLGFKYGDSAEVYYGKTITADIDGGGDVSGRVVTDMITLTGSSKNSIDINLPEGVWMKYKNIWYKSGSVSISGNASIRFSLTAGDTNTYTLSNLKGKRGCDVYEINTGSNTQTLYYGITDYSQISFTLKAKEEEKPVFHEMSLSKELKDNKCNLSVSGAEYTVYYVKDTTSTGKKYPVATFTIDADGKGKVTDVYPVDCTTSGHEASFTAKGKNKTVLSGLPEGVYRVDETEAPAGLVKAASFYVDFTNHKNSSNKEYSITYTKSDDAYSASCTSFEEALNDPVSITLYKYDANTNDKAAAGNASLENARFEVKFYAGKLYDTVPNGVAATDTWVIKTIYQSDGRTQTVLDKKHAVSHTGSTGYNDDGSVDLTLGTVTITEIQSPKGYNKAADGGKIKTAGGTDYGTNTIILQNKVGADGKLHLYSGKADASGGVKVYNTLQDDAIIVYEPEKRYDLKFKKTDADGKPMAGVAFEVKAGSGESHIVITDENGEFDSSVRKGTAFNENDALYKSYLETGEIPEYQYTDLYFYGNMEDKSKADLTLGSCYMDTYTVTELPCAANKGYKLAEPVTKQVRDDSSTVSFDFGIIVNNEITLKTTTNDGLADKKLIYPEDKDITLTDTVSYTNLYTDGREYTLKGKLMCKETGEVVIRSDGTEVTGETTFIPETENGTVTVEFKYNPYDCGLVGKTTVVFEDLYNNDELVVSHADISDEAQTNYYPTVSTTLTGENGSKMVLFSDDVTLIDKVSYKNIIAGETYIIEGVIINKDTGKPLMIDGEEVRNTVTFTADTSSGTIDVSYNFNAESAGLVKTDENGNVSYSDVVCYEYLYYAGAGDKSLKAEHEDINDSNQTVTFPSGHTTALTADGSHEAAPVKQLTITDTVYYRGLIEGLEYTVTGKIMDKETGKPFMVNGEEITNTVTFTAETSSGTVDVEFTFDASSLEGKSIVVFEDMKYQEQTIFIHADLSDSNQTISFPDTPDTPKIPNVPKTGDKGIFFFICIFVLSAAIAAVLIKKRAGLKR